MDLRSNFRVRRGVIVPVSRAGEEGVGWREVVEVEVFVVGGAGGLCHWEGVGVGVFASMSMVVVVVQRTKWSVLLSCFCSGFLLTRWAVFRYTYIYPHFFFLFLLFFLFFFLFFFLSSLLHPYNKAQGKKRQDEAK